MILAMGARRELGIEFDLAKVMRIELGKPGKFDRPMTQEEIIDKLEQRIGHEGRVIFENFVREMQRLEARQQVEQQQQQRQQQEQERRQQRQHHAGAAMEIRKSTNW